NVMKFKNKPKLGQIWTFHDNDRHQAIGHFGPKSSHSAPPSMRSDERRAQLKPWVKPTKMKNAYDRTHIIPFGFHGSESDPRLVVGWLQRDNRNKFKVFENKHRNYNTPIYWFVDISRIKSGGAKWTYRIYDARTLKLIHELTSVTSLVLQWKKDDESKSISKEQYDKVLNDARQLFLERNQLKQHVRQLEAVLRQRDEEISQLNHTINELENIDAFDLTFNQLKSLFG